jgi:type II secretion system protein G
MNETFRRITCALATASVMAMTIARPATAQTKPDPELAGRKAYEVDGKRAEWMKGHWGVMTHYLLAWQSREHNLPMNFEQWNRMVDAFDVEGLADQIKSTGASYHILTIGQGTTHLITPSPLYDELFGPKPSNCAHRDLVADMAAADASRGIRLIVYATSGPFGGSRSLGSTNGNPAGDYRNKQRMLAWERVLRQWSLRWGDKVSGWWFDGCYTPNRTYNYPDPPNFQSEAAAARAGNPMAAVTFNRGVMDRPISITPYEDYTGGEINDIQTVRPWRIQDGQVDGARMHLLSYLGQKWGTGQPRYQDLDDIVIPQTLRLLEMGGAVTWDTPVQPGGLIASNFLAQLQAIGRAVAAAPKGTLAELTAARTRATTNDFGVIGTALERFEADLGRYPTTDEGLAALVHRPAGAAAAQWKGPYLEVLRRDAFGARYRYVSPGSGGAEYDLISSGPDLEFGTRDDISADVK